MKNIFQENDNIAKKYLYVKKEEFPWNISGMESLQSTDHDSEHGGDREAAVGIVVPYKVTAVPEE